MGNRNTNLDKTKSKKCQHYKVEYDGAASKRPIQERMLDFRLEEQDKHNDSEKSPHQPQHEEYGVVWLRESTPLKHYFHRN